MAFEGENRAPYHRTAHGQSVSPSDENQTATESERILADRSLLLKDPANLCTFINCIVGFLALAYICHDRFYVGMSFIMLGNILDIIDGRIANATPNRHPIVKEFGRMLDPLVEALMSNMAPAFVLMKLGGFNMVPVCIAALFIVVGNFRTGKYFVVGHIHEGGRVYYPGMWAEYNLCLLGILGLLMPMFSRSTMTWLWASTLLLLCLGMLTARIRSYRYQNKDLKLVLSFCSSLLGSYIFLAMKEAYVSPDCGLWEHALLGLHVTLAYPCLFKFIEIKV